MTELEKAIDKEFKKHTKLIMGLYRGEPILTPETMQLKQALLALIESEARKARIDELLRITGGDYGESENSPNTLYRFPTLRNNCNSQYFRERLAQLDEGKE